MSTLDLQEIRKQLDRIDTEIVALFQERLCVSGDVARSKMGTGKPVYDGAREKQKLDTLSSLVEEAFDKDAVTELFTQIMTISRRYQYQIMAEHGFVQKTEFRPVKELQTEGAHIVYQGVEGAYSHEASMQFFGAEADLYHVKTFEDAVKEVEEGRADYAVLPIENSSAGAVTDNYDLLIKYHNYIVAEIFLPVNHALLGLADAGLDGIRTVFSHPQGLMQCSEYLSGHREWKQISVENTAGAAKKVLEDGDVTQAAIASEAAGSLYGLKVLAPSVNHNKNNTTRFIILSKNAVYREDAGKVSISFELPHKSGSLYNMLSNFIYNHVNMMMIESRPIPGKTWEYRFFVDLEGNLGDVSIQNALTGIAAEAANLRILGNY